ncbi:MAG: tetraacyldisaccharide 4'-kinase [Thermodesulfobacteriota bacterium]|nr:tetraacyldisaccharide 4'-kinase [Thermodesulfobacteriota bacterium]
MTRPSLYSPNPGLWRRIPAGIYGLAVRLRLWLDRKGFWGARTLPAWVISVGNLTVGGTGKTPAVILIARSMRDRGYRTAVLSRGYRSRSSERVNVVSDGENIILEPDQAGDEAYLMAGRLPGVPVLTGPGRWSVGRYALDRFKTQVFVLDDGFQHRHLARDVNLLLLDAAQPWGNGRLLPAGALREPRDQARRAGAFLLTRAEQLPSGLMEELERDFPGRPIFTARHKPTRLVRLADEKEETPGYLAGRRVLAFCGLARPRTFLKTLAGLGAEVVLFIQWPDHYQPKDRDLKMLETKAQELGLDEAVTTAKDAVKLAGRALGRETVKGLDVWVLEVEMEILDRADEFMGMLEPTGKGVQG